MNINNFAITPEMLIIIAEIEEFKGSWRTLRTLAPEKLAALRKVATIESIGSSTRIEGVKLSDRQIETLLSNLDPASFTSRDEQEVAGYAEVMEILFNSWETIPITENYLKQLHSILLKYSDKDERHRGNYKFIDNHIEAFNQEGKSLGIILETASTFDTPLLMESLIIWTRNAIEEKQIHPLMIIGIFIVQFLAIHPFQDGNGRISRIVTTWLLLKTGYTYVPYSSLETIIEENKESYYLALRQTQKSFKTDSPNYTPWLLFFFSLTETTKRSIREKIRKGINLSNGSP
ncbi:Fic family protein [Crocosphaera sp. XPORK-15E]|uniref:Fic family protein n=1 Tax=Crocosphaera sp. XPORK-15E TaxID=3110247 RepID=UPI002B20DDAC|nr:Fic family protein [Crocosphaera sp. XPORK-15E]MEA5537135.1 Fic family protein [Crocosphaera sp. XPORK-15E]